MTLARTLLAATILTTGLLTNQVFAQTGPSPYGASITIEQA